MNSYIETNWRIALRRICARPSLVPRILHRLSSMDKVKNQLCFHLRIRHPAQLGLASACRGQRCRAVIGYKLTDADIAALSLLFASRLDNVSQLFSNITAGVLRVVASRSDGSHARYHVLSCSVFLLAEPRMAALLFGKHHATRAC